ncbi:MAG: hypothetical protein WCJ58_08060 [bacterium]
MNELHRTILNIMIPLGFPEYESNEIAKNLVSQVIILTLNDFLDAEQKAKLNVLAEKNDPDLLMAQLGQYTIDANQLQTKFTLHTETVLTEFFSAMLEKLPEDKVEEFKKLMKQLENTSKNITVKTDITSSPKEILQDLAA